MQTTSTWNQDTTSLNHKQTHWPFTIVFYIQPVNSKTMANKSHIGNIIMTVIAVIIVIVAGIYFFGFFSRNSHYEETNDAQVEAYINPVSARAAGYIQHINFEENQLVKQGDTLVILDDREYRK